MQNDTIIILSYTTGTLFISILVLSNIILLLLVYDCIKDFFKQRKEDTAQNKDPQNTQNKELEL